jgi:hypothetical protein
MTIKKVSAKVMDRWEIKITNKIGFWICLAAEDWISKIQGNIYLTFFRWDKGGKCHQKGFSFLK